MLLQVIDCLILLAPALLETSGKGTAGEKVRTRSHVRRAKQDIPESAQPALKSALKRFDVIH